MGQLQKKLSPSSQDLGSDGSQHHSLKVISTPSLRYERKSVVSGSSLQEVNFHIKIHPLHFSQIHQQRRVNSIYFDTPSFQFYEDNVSGSPKRRKMRIRWYGETDSLVSDPVLEIKGKQGVLGYKEHYSLKAFNLSQRELFRQLKDLTKDCSSDEVREYFKYLCPISYVSYTRNYFLSKNKEFRLTVDTDISYQPAKNLLSRNFSAVKDSNIVIEIKYDEKSELKAPTLFDQTPWRLMKNSKYVNSVDAIKLYA